MLDQSRRGQISCRSAFGIVFGTSAAGPVLRRCARKDETNSRFGRWDLFAPTGSAVALPNHGARRLYCHRAQCNCTANGSGSTTAAPARVFGSAKPTHSPDRATCRRSYGNVCDGIGDHDHVMVADGNPFHIGNPLHRAEGTLNAFRHVLAAQNRRNLPLGPRPYAQRTTTQRRHIPCRGSGHEARKTNHVDA